LPGFTTQLSSAGSILKGISQALELTSNIIEEHSCRDQEVLNYATRNLNTLKGVFSEHLIPEDLMIESNDWLVKNQKRLESLVKLFYQGFIKLFEK